MPTNVPDAPHPGEKLRASWAARLVAAVKRIIPGVSQADLAQTGPGGTTRYAPVPYKPARPGTPHLLDVHIRDQYYEIYFGDADPRVFFTRNGVRADSIVDLATPPYLDGWYRLVDVAPADADHFLSARFILPQGETEPSTGLTALFFPRRDTPTLRVEFFIGLPTVDELNNGARVFAFTEVYEALQGDVYGYSYIVHSAAHGLHDDRNAADSEIYEFATGVPYRKSVEFETGTSVGQLYKFPLANYTDTPPTTPEEYGGECHILARMVEDDGDTHRLAYLPLDLLAGAIMDAYRSYFNMLDLLLGMPCPSDGLGDTVAWDPCAQEWTSLRGLWWKCGGDENWCFGSAIGDVSKTKVIDLASKTLSGMWYTDDDFHTGQNCDLHVGGDLFVGGDRYAPTNVTIGGQSYTILAKV